jgi:hypothetical protein
MIQALKQAINIYKNQGHKIQEVDFTEHNQPTHTILTDSEFKMLREDVEGYGIRVNITTKEDMFLKWRDKLSD